jgi:hypothetical protein
MSSKYADTLSHFADRLFVTGGSDPGDDALAIAPERLAVYHELLRGNYTSMIRFAYTMTFRLIASDITSNDARPGWPESVHEITRKYLEAAPAHNHSTRHIADVFQEYFLEHWTAITDERPEIPDLMRLERAELEALYHFDDPGTSPSGAELETLQASPVEEFLALRVVRAPSAAFLRLDHPCTAIHHRMLHRDRYEPGELTGAERVAVSRHPETLAAVFTTLDEAPFLVCELAPVGCEVGIEELAGEWIERLPPDFAANDDTWKLTTFASSVFTGLATGYFRLA